jgi:hypothetical protein
VHVKLDSTPPGARVLDASDRRVLGVTPFEQDLPRGQGSLPLLLELDGHLPRTVKVSLERSSDQTVPLKPARPAAGPPPRPRPAPADEDDARKL